MHLKKRRGEEKDRVDVDLELESGDGQVFQILFFLKKVFQILHAWHLSVPASKRCLLAASEPNHLLKQSRQTDMCVTSKSRAIWKQWNPASNFWILNRTKNNGKCSLNEWIRKSCNFGSNDHEKICTCAGSELCLGVHAYACMTCF